MVHPLLFRGAAISVAMITLSQEKIVTGLHVVQCTEQVNSVVETPNSEDNFVEFIQCALPQYV
jgi:hypothetical protein